MRRVVVSICLLLTSAPAHAVAAAPLSEAAVQAYVSAPTKQTATIIIEKIKLKAPIYVGITDDVFDRGVGHWPGTPTAGKNGNVVLGGHRTSANAPFLNIHKLKSGDIVSIVVKKKTFRYKVTGHSIVKPSAVWITNQTRTPTLTLFSCHPLGKVTHRYVVRAVLVA